MRSMKKKRKRVSKNKTRGHKCQKRKEKKKRFTKRTGEKPPKLKLNK
jgi:hypothetical protein